MPVPLSVELDREVDGRWIAEVPAIPGAIVYGTSAEEAVAAVRRLVIEVLEDQRAAGESAVPDEGLLLMAVGGYVATVVPSGIDGVLAGYVDGMPGAHTQAESLDELYLNLSEVIALVTEDDHVPANPAEERLSTREN